MIVRVAAAQYPIDAIASWETYADKLARCTGEASANGARLLLFPEYGAMELARMFAPEVWSDLRQSIDFVGGEWREPHLRRRRAVLVLSESERQHLRRPH